MNREEALHIFSHSEEIVSAHDVTASIESMRMQLASLKRCGSRGVGIGAAGFVGAAVSEDMKFLLGNVVIRGGDILKETTPAALCLNSAGHQIAMVSGKPSAELL